MTKLARADTDGNREDADLYATTNRFSTAGTPGTGQDSDAICFNRSFELFANSFS